MTRRDIKITKEPIQYNILVDINVLDDTIEYVVINSPVGLPIIDDEKTNAYYKEKNDYEEGLRRFTNKFIRQKKMNACLKSNSLNLLQRHLLISKIQSMYPCPICKSDERSDRTGSNLKYVNENGYLRSFCSEKCHDNIKINTYYRATVTIMHLLKIAISQIILCKLNSIYFGSNSCNFEFLKKIYTNNNNDVSSYDKDIHLQMKNIEKEIKKLTDNYKSAHGKNDGKFTFDSNTIIDGDGTTESLRKMLVKIRTEKHPYYTVQKRYGLVTKTDELPYPVVTKKNYNISKAFNEFNNKIAIIIPFYKKDATSKYIQYLDTFIQHINQMFNRSDNISIYVIEQTNKNSKINRGILLNLGFQQAYIDDCTSFIFHDVDLLPSFNLKDLYLAYPHNPLHIGFLWKRYEYQTYFGGINVFSADDYMAINGFPNNFYGWGGEDDAVRARLSANKIKVNIPDSYPSSATKQCLLENTYSIQDLENYTITEKLKELNDNNLKLAQNLKISYLEEDKTIWKYNGVFNLKKNLKNKRYSQDGITVIYCEYDDI
jgi:hypothetical protein